MVSNPMQRKVRNSFLLGILVMLVITLVIGAIVFFMVIKPRMDSQEEEVTYVKVYQLKTDVRSGDEITYNMVELVDLPSTSVPSDAINSLNTDSATIARVDLGRGAILSSGVIAADEQELDDSLRTVEYNMITLPTILEPGETVDVRITFANGQDLIILSKKRVEDIYGNTVLLNLTEGEILMMNSAIVEAYIMPTSNLYITKYTQAGDQTAATPTYVPTTEVQNLIAVNANITAEARQNFTNRFIPGMRDYYINPQINQYSEEARYNIETGIQEQIEAARSAREEYLSELEGY